MHNFVNVSTTLYLRCDNIHVGVKWWMSVVQQYFLCSIPLSLSLTLCLSLSVCLSLSLLSIFVSVSVSPTLSLSLSHTHTQSASPPPTLIFPQTPLCLLVQVHLKHITNKQYYLCMHLSLSLSLESDLCNAAVL